MKYVLASASPRRKMLLEQYIEHFKIIPADIDETIDPEKPLLDEIINLALRKAVFASGKCRREDVIIAADTLVVKDGVVYNKPADRADARRMLTELCGATHTVITAVAIIHGDTVIKFADSTDVTFREFTEGIMEWYLSTGEPLDRAGAYAVQGLGAILVSKVDGDYNTVVGLPVAQLIYSLHENGLFKFK